MVRRPEHGPGIDVEDLTSASGDVLAIILSSRIEVRKRAPIMGNSPVFAVGHQSESAKNVSHRDDVDYRLRSRLIE